MHVCVPMCAHCVCDGNSQEHLHSPLLSPPKASPRPDPRPEVPETCPSGHLPAGGRKSDRSALPAERRFLKDARPTREWDGGKASFALPSSPSRAHTSILAPRRPLAPGAPSQCAHISWERSLSSQAQLPSNEVVDQDQKHMPTPSPGHPLPVAF